MKKLMNQSAIDKLNNPEHQDWLYSFIATHPELDTPLLYVRPIDYADTVDISGLKHPELNMVEELSRLWNELEDEIIQIDPQERLKYADADTEATIGYKRNESIPLSVRRQNRTDKDYRDFELGYQKEMNEYIDSLRAGKLKLSREEINTELEKIKKKWNRNDEKTRQAIKDRGEDPHTDEHVWIYCAVVVDSEGDVHRFNNSLALIASMVNFERMIFHNSAYDGTILVQHAVNLYSGNNERIFENTTCHEDGYDHNPWDYLISSEEFAFRQAQRKHLRKAYDILQTLPKNSEKRSKLIEKYPELENLKEKPGELTKFSSFHLKMIELQMQGNDSFNPTALFIPWQGRFSGKVNVRKNNEDYKASMRKPHLYVQGSGKQATFGFYHGGKLKDYVPLTPTGRRSRSEKGVGWLTCRIVDSKKLINASVREMGEDFTRLYQLKIANGEKVDVPSFKKGGEKGTQTPLLYDLRDWIEKSARFKEDVWEYCEQDVKIVTAWLDEPIQLDEKNIFVFRKAILKGYESAALLAVSSINSIREQIGKMEGDYSFYTDNRGRTRLEGIDFGLTERPMMDQPYAVESTVWRDKYFEKNPQDLKIYEGSFTPNFVTSLREAEVTLKKFSRNKNPDDGEALYISKLQEEYDKLYKKAVADREKALKRIEEKIFVYCMTFSATGFAGGFANNILENTVNIPQRKRRESDTDFFRRASSLKRQSPTVNTGLGVVVDASSMYPTNAETYMMPGKIIDRKRTPEHVFAKMKNPARARLREYSNVDETNVQSWISAKNDKMCMVMVNLKATLSKNAPRTLISGHRFRNHAKIYNLPVIDEYTRDLEGVMVLTNVHLKMLWELTNTGKNVERFEILECMEYEPDYPLMMAYEEFVAYWGEVKKRGSETKNPVLKNIGKLFLNSEYGKHGNFKKRYPTFDPMTDEDISAVGGMEFANIHRACFVTAHARFRLTRLMKQVGVKNTLGGDTDSVHFKLPEDMASQCLTQNSLAPLVKELSKYVKMKDDFGGWTIDDVFEMSIYPRSKTYLLGSLEYDEKDNVRNGRDQYYLSGKVARTKDGKRKFKAVSAGYRLRPETTSADSLVKTYLNAGMVDNLVVVSKSDHAKGGLVIRKRMQSL